MLTKINCILLLTSIFISVMILKSFYDFKNYIMSLLHIPINKNNTILNDDDDDDKNSIDIKKFLYDDNLEEEFINIDGEKDIVNGEKNIVNGEKDIVSGEKDIVSGEKDIVSGEKK